MRKCIPHRIAAISMALLLLLTSIGFSVDVHYCQDNVAGINFFGEAKSCHDIQGTPSCHKTEKACHHQEKGICPSEKDNCCHNESIIIEKVDIDATSPQIATVQNSFFDFWVVFVSAYILNQFVVADFHHFNQHKPPIPDRDIQLLYQIFLV